MPPRLAAIDLEPASEVRPMEGRVRRLLVDTGLRGADAEAAWVTVSGGDGAIHFEGMPSADGRVEVSFTGAVESAHVQLETTTLHRQAEVKLGEGLTSYAFA
jgi:hypothetical protein